MSEDVFIDMLEDDEQPPDEGLDETPCSPCAECGMLTSGEDYHPYGACLMFKACGDGAVVRANLWAIQERSYNIGRRVGENCKPSVEANHGQANEKSPDAGATE
jgi:hypothetical protein